jgi:hypothetical protein
MKLLPDLLAKCAECCSESNCHPPETVAWSPKKQQWLCSDCFFDDGVYDAERDEYVNEEPLCWAADALDSDEEMERRVVAAMTARRLGV